LDLSTSDFRGYANFEYYINLRGRHESITDERKRGRKLICEFNFSDNCEEII
jgi:hypothetical protein